MDRRGSIELRLISICTLRGALYGLVGGAVTGVLLFIIGALVGAAIGIIVGPFFGMANALAIRAFAPYGRRNLSLDAYRRDLYVCCILASVLLDAGIGLFGYAFLDLSFLFYTIIALPAIIISACCLAGVVADWYPRQVDIRPVEYVVADSDDVWPPAPKRG